MEPNEETSHLCLQHSFENLLSSSCIGHPTFSPRKMGWIRLPTWLERKGYTNCRNTIYNPDGSVKWSYEYPKDEQGKSTKSVKVSPYEQEHIDLIAAIRTNKPYTEAEDTAISTLVAIMGRISAYTGQEVTWEKVMSSDLQLGPKEYKFGPVEVDKIVATPGTV